LVERAMEYLLEGVPEASDNFRGKR